jgi:septal ring factor EnvC (AmiA/AmiB activator)
MSEQELEACESYYEREIARLRVECDDLRAQYDAALEGQAAVRQQCEAQMAERERGFMRECELLHAANGRLKDEIARLRAENHRAWTAIALALGEDAAQAFKAEPDTYSGGVGQEA